MNKILVSVFIVLFGTAIRTAAQQLSNPLDFPIQLSGGFCDLRANHFHAGIDFRTKGTEGHALHAVSNGYISRISVSPWGYGLAIYITHPEDDIITVYGHMQRFTGPVTDIVKEKQYEEESFAVDLNIDPGVLPVKQGDVIGYSGNSGSSGGPHLHFEVRDLQNNNLLDPLTYYKSRVTDTKKPQVKGLMIYPIEGKGVVNGSSHKQKIEFKNDANGDPVVSTAIEAWGEIGLGISAIDRIDGSGFSYGLKDILQTVDGRETFRSHADRFSFEESRSINSYTDYGEWSRNRVFYIKTFVEPGCSLRMVASRNSGMIQIDEERIYHVMITLSDLYGNACPVSIPIKGKKQEIQPADTAGTHRMRWYDYNIFASKGIRLNIPRNSLYGNLCMYYNASSLKGYKSTLHTLHQTPVPLHRPAQLSIHIDSAYESIMNEQLGIVRMGHNGQRSWIGGTFRDGWIDAEISELGDYTIAYDIKPPVITPVDPGKWQERKQIKIRITDDLSGISTYRGEIDGRYALFCFDGKKALLTYDFDSERLPPGYHRLKLSITDRCGNRSIYEHTFTW
ncbi:MAG: M23 family metallopeptidase [Tannerella sp.]|jgi:hypothetical protein|nr:M23 family metallopeptidase [Tannerella sp.]